MDNRDGFDILCDRLNTHLHEPEWQERLLEEISQQEPQNIAKLIKTILDRNSDYEQWLHRDLLLAGRCLVQNVQSLKVTDNSLCWEILQRLVELEADDRLRVGQYVSDRLFEVFCSFSGTDFEAQVLQLLNDRAELIDKWQLVDYQAALGEKERAIATLITWLDNPNRTIGYYVSKRLVKLDDGSQELVNLLLARLKDKNANIRCTALSTLGRLGNNSQIVIEQHQDSKFLGYGIDALWLAIEAREVKIPRYRYDSIY